MKVSKIDVLVIGGGGAAARAALEAANEGVNVLMVMKGEFTHSGATAFEASEMAGFNAGDGAADENDSPEEHYKDIMDAADGMSIPSLSRIVAYEAVDTLKTLDSWGVNYEKDNGKYLAFKSCFSKRPRTHVIKGHGKPILEALNRKIKEKKNIKMIENAFVAELIVENGICCGAVIIDQSGNMSIIEAKSTILATGGAGQVFEKSLNPKDITGDGYALGFRAGAKLINMEFMQSGIGISYPIVSLLNAYIWSGLPKLRNRYNEDFMKEGLPSNLTTEMVMNDHANHFPFSCYDNSFYIETLVQKQLLEGKGTDEGGIYMDLTHMTDEYVNSIEENTGLRKMWPIAREYYESLNVRVMEEPVQIACFAHAINGGLLIDENSSTSIEGLYAAGETAGGPHGADRLGGNMILTCQIYGKIAGLAAAKRAKNLSKQADISSANITEKIESIKEILYKDLDYTEIQQKLKENTQKHLLIRRTEEGLSSLIELINQLKKEILQASASTSYNIANLETMNMLIAAELMSFAAIQRKESRGAHYRADYPNKDDANFRAPLVLSKDGEQISSCQFKVSEQR